MMINPGSLKHPVTILRYSEKVDAEGFKTKDWIPVFKCRAALTKAKVKDIGTEEISTSKTSIECVIRFAEIYHTDKVEISGKQYEITDIDNIDFENRFLKVGLK